MLLVHLDQSQLFKIWMNVNRQNIMTVIRRQVVLTLGELIDGCRCECNAGYIDLYAGETDRADRQCITCSRTFCNNRGKCSFSDPGNQICVCVKVAAMDQHARSMVFFVIGASVAAIIIIILKLTCLIMYR
jgi:hypothetical protein